MSMSYWVCQGIGFEQTSLISTLDVDKLLSLVKEELGNIVDENELEEDYLFSTLSNEKKIDVLMKYYIKEQDWQLPELLQKKDAKNVLICASNNEGSYYLLYPPKYPWEESGGFTSQEEVVKYIFDLIKAYCLDDVPDHEIFAAIDVDVYEVGCG
jgi:hypothetical protein